MDLLKARRRKFSVEEYYRMAEAGIFTEDDRVELIEGEIVEMTPIGGRHAACVNRLNALLVREAGDAAIVSVQNPVRLSERIEPQPDLTLLRPRDDFYAEGHPTPKDVLLVMEVSDTTLSYDREVKIPLYARSGIPEVWVVDLISGAEILAYSRPVGGAYEAVSRAAHGEPIASRTIPGLTLSVDDILG